MTSDPTPSDLQARVAELEAQLEQQRQSQAYLRAMLGAMRDVMLVVDSEGVCRDVPSSNRDLVDRPSEELVGLPIGEIFPGDSARAYPGHIRAVLASRETRRITTSAELGGRTVWCDSSISPLSETSVLWVARDVSAQVRDQEERRELQDQIIQAQQATLQELSTPLIPLADGVLAMPIIGAIDSRRAQQIMETLLEGISTQQAHAAILDITGVRVVDTQVANALLRAAQAARLLGARVVLTGISAEVAQALIHLGADLSTIITRSSIQSGIAYVLEEEELV